MKVRILEDYHTGDLQFVFYLERGRGSVNLYNPMTHELKEHKVGELIPEDFFLRFSLFDSKELRKSFLEELNQKSVDDEIVKLQAELAATKKHLEDLRGLLQLVLKPASPAEKGE